MQQIELSEKKESNNIRIIDIHSQQQQQQMRREDEHSSSSNSMLYAMSKIVFATSIFSYVFILFFLSFELYITLSLLSLCERHIFGGEEIYLSFNVFSLQITFFVYSSAFTKRVNVYFSIVFDCHIKCLKLSHSLSLVIM